MKLISIGGIGLITATPHCQLNAAAFAILLLIDPLLAFSIIHYIIHYCGHCPVFALYSCAHTVTIDLYEPSYGAMIGMWSSAKSCMSLSEARFHVSRLLKST